MDAQTVTIEVQGTRYGVRFGYGAFRMLGKHLGVDDLASVFSRLGKLGDLQKGKLSFETLDYLANLVLAGIISQHGDDVDVTADDIADELLKDPSKMESVMTAFVAAMPQQDKPGAKKKKAPVKKQTRIKKS